jgi:hypothetical protein
VLSPFLSKYCQIRPAVLPMSAFIMDSLLIVSDQKCPCNHWLGGFYSRGLIVSGFQNFSMPNEQASVCIINFFQSKMTANKSRPFRCKMT